MTAAVISPGTHAWHATRRSDLEPGFRLALRHSRRVRWLRTGIPFAVLAAGVLYGLASWFIPLGALAYLPQAARLAVSGSKITMDLPRLAGYTPDGRSYELTARAAAQDLKRPHVIELQDIRAKIELQDKSLVNVAADTGLYDTKAETVVLSRNIIVTASSGYEVRLREAKLDIRKGHILSEQPVEVLLSNGRLDAKQLEVTDTGSVVQFRGGVTMTLTPDSGSAPPATAAEARP